MAKVKSRVVSYPSYNALCVDCGWIVENSEDSKDELARVRRAIRKHVVHTGHKVSLQAVKIVIYELVE